MLILNATRNNNWISMKCAGLIHEENKCEKE